MTAPAGGCASVEVAVVTASYERARRLATAAGFRVGGRRPSTTVRARIDPEAMYAVPDSVDWRGGDGAVLDQPRRQALASPCRTPPR